MIAMDPCLLRRGARPALALAFPFLMLGGCGASDGSALLTVELTGLRTDASRLNFKIYRAECLGSHPCDTWLAQTPLSQQATGSLSYPLRLPAEVLDLTIHLRIETTQLVGFSKQCIGARATTVMARRGADYANTSLSLALNRDSDGPTFAVRMPMACPLHYAPEGSGTGSLSITLQGQQTITDSSKFPDELLRGTPVTVVAMPKSGSTFTGWDTKRTTVCPNPTDPSCAFSIDDEVTLAPVFTHL